MNIDWVPLAQWYKAEQGTAAGLVAGGIAVAFGYDSPLLLIAIQAIFNYGGAYLASAAE